MSLICAMIKTYKGNNLEQGQAKKLQNKRLNELVKYARNNSPYFNKLYANINEDYKLKDLPTTNKIDMMKNFDNWITDNTHLYKKYGILWKDLNRLSDYGLIKLVEPENGFPIKARNSQGITYGNEYVIMIGNNTDIDLTIKMPGYVLTEFAMELQVVINRFSDLDIVRDYINLMKNTNNGFAFTLHKCHGFDDNGNYKIDYSEPPLYGC